MSLALLSLSLLALSGVPTRPSFQEQYSCRAVSGTRISLEENHDRRRMLMVDRTQCLDVRSQGRVAFTANDADLDALSPGGYLDVTEQRDGITRRMVFTERNGRITRQYTVDGDTRPESDAHEWLRAVLPRVARESTIGAEARVTRILQDRGPAGVMRELEVIHSESIKGMYVEAMLDDPRTGPGELRDLSRRLPALMTSDSRRSTVMTTLLARAGNDPSVVDAVLESTRSISSDRQRALVLREVLQRANLTRPTMLAVLRSAGGISSDREKSGVLIALASHREAMTDETVRRAFLETTRSISSSSEYRRVMEAVVR